MPLLSGRRPVELGNERRLVSLEKALDFRDAPDEVFREFAIWRLSYYDNERNAVSLDRRQLIGCVANPAVVRDCDPPLLSAMFQPLLIRAFGKKKVVMRLNLQTGLTKSFRKSLPEIAISEINPAQAARS